MLKTTIRLNGRLYAISLPLIIALTLVLGLIGVIATTPARAEGPNQQAGNDLSITKKASDKTAKEGETITYTYWVTNSGSVDLSVVAYDDKLGPLPLMLTGSGTFGTLNTLILYPGGTAGGILTHTIVQSDLPGPLVNTVTVTGTTLGTAQLVITATDTASVELGEVFEVDPTHPTPQLIVSADGVLTIIIRGSALPGNASQFVYMPLATPSVTPPPDYAGLAFSLELLDAAGNPIPSPTFDPPLDMTILYDEAQLPPGLAEDELGIFFYDSVAQEWTAAKVITRDTVLNTITVEVSHFTEFALAGVQPMFNYFPIIFKNASS